MMHQTIGAYLYPARVFKGMRMAVKMGSERVKVQNLKVLAVDEKRIYLL